ncbi:hypothetical protein TL16_g01719 [Triparma laevis f. inornata]|uniref:SET domain-containing protein n=1 Tax=Triparma laevis f. inornata TaxID=1714386 RepID=A0A9W7DTP1_9STRA|nr:hypothetical protein TL16_g01719 [Triparma laevis f. inornata]
MMSRAGGKVLKSREAAAFLHSEVVLAAVVAPQRKLFIIGFGSVARSMLVRLRSAVKAKTIAPFSHVTYFAPEITATCGFEKCVDDEVFSFRHIPQVTVKTLGALMNTLVAAGAADGDVVCELACRIDTVTIWRECKARGLHFCNSGFDVWEDQELDLDNIKVFRNDPEFNAGPGGRTSVIGFGMNPGIISHLAVLVPGKFEIRGDCYDQLGVILLSETWDPFFCGVTLTVDDAALQDPSKKCGPTPLQVCGGVWSCLRFIVDQPLAGDCFPEDVPTPFVMAHALPGAGTLTCCPCPEALAVPAFFDPSAPDAGDVILAATLAPGNGVGGDALAHDDALAETSGVGVVTPIALARLERMAPIEGAKKGVAATETIVRTAGFPFNHSCAPNCYLDRNRAVKTMGPMAAGAELTVDYALTASAAKAPKAQLGPGEACACGSKVFACRGPVGDWRGLPAATMRQYLDNYPILREVEEEARGLSLAPAAAGGGKAQRRY